MEILSEAKALAALERHLDPFVKIIQGGWADYRDEYSEKLQAIHTPTTRASLVHDHQVERASRYAEAASGVRIGAIEKLRVIVIDDRFSIRLKKMDSSLMPANWLTDQVRDFRGQHQLPGLPPTFNLELGYVLDSSDTTIRMVGLAYPNGVYQNFWGIDLLKRQMVNYQTVFDFAKPTEEEVAEEEGVIITPKRDVIPFKRKDKDEN